MHTLKNLWQLLFSKYLVVIFPGLDHKSEEELLITSIHTSLTEWKTAKSQFNQASPELVDYMVYRLNAAERQYIALLEQAKKRGIKSWPDNLAEPVKVREPVPDSVKEDSNGILAAYSAD